MRRLYISGPMSGIPDNNVTVFRDAAATLRAQGHFVVSPHEVTDPTASIDYGEFLIRDLEAMITMRLNTLVLLPGWYRSNGALLEFQIAQRLGWDMLFFDGTRLINMARGDARTVGV